MRHASSFGERMMMVGAMLTGTSWVNAVYLPTSEISYACTFTVPSRLLISWTAARTWRSSEPEGS
jgi:hypothetical protein